MMMDGRSVSILGGAAASLALWWLMAPSPARAQAAKPAPPAPAKPPAPVCVAASDSMADSIALDGNKLKYCFEGSAVRCYATELDTGRTMTGPTPPGDSRPRIVPATPGPKVEVGDEDLKVCKADGGGCKAFKPKDEVDPGLGLTGAVSASGALAALANGVYVETFDVASGKRLGRFKAGPKPWLCTGVEFAGETVVVHHSECGSSSSQSWLATVAGKKIAGVGGTKAIDPAWRPAHVEATRWAFVAQSGDALVIQDVKSGKLVKKISLGPAGKDGSPTVVGGAGKLVVLFSGVRAGDVVVIDTATDKVTSYAGKRCP